MNKPGLTLKVWSDHMLPAKPESLRVMFNDIDISAAVMSLDISIDRFNVTQATIKIRPQSVEIDARAFAILQAVIPATKGISDDL